MTMKFGFGQPLTRKEDDTLLRGAGRYIADVEPAASLHAVVVRSPHAHARFRIGDLGRVRAMPGVRLVLTAADIGHLGSLPTPGVLPDVEIKIPTHPILAREIVRYVGDSVAFIVADTLAAAKDAAESAEYIRRETGTTNRPTEGQCAEGRTHDAIVIRLAESKSACSRYSDEIKLGALGVE